MADQNYFASEAISNSDLGYLKLSPRQFILRKRKDMQTKSGAMELGSLIHMFTLEPDSFIIADVEPVGGKMGEYIKAYYELERSNTPEDKIPDLAYKVSGYKPTHSKPETVLKSFKNKQENVAFYNYLKESTDKIALNTKDKNIIEGCLQSLRSHKQSNELLFSEAKDDIEVFNEEEMFFNLHDVDCKSKLDRIIVDNKNKVVTIVDLKTTSNQVYGDCTKLDSDTGILTRDWYTTGFMYSCLQYSYYRQLAFYISAAKSKYPDYEVKAFIIAVDTKGFYDVAVYKLPDEWIQEGNDQIKCLLTEYKNYKESNNWHVKEGYEDVVEY